MLASNSPKNRHWFILYGVVGILLLVAQFYYLRKDDREKFEQTKDLKTEIGNLKEQTTTLLNAVRLQATIEDFRHLETVIGNGFAHLESVIREKKVVPQITTQPTEPAVVENIRIVQHRAASDDQNAPYGLQVLMQTNIVVQPVAFSISCDRAITEAKVFIVGEGVYTMFAKKFSDDRKTFMFSFHSPPFRPESSLVVALQSKEDLHVVRVDKIQPMF